MSEKDGKKLLRLQKFLNDHAELTDNFQKTCDFEEKYETLKKKLNLMSSMKVFSASPKKLNFFRRLTKEYYNDTGFLKNLLKMFEGTTEYEQFSEKLFRKSQQQIAIRKREVISTHSLFRPKRTWKGQLISEIKIDKIQAKPNKQRKSFKVEGLRKFISEGKFQKINREFINKYVSKEEDQKVTSKVQKRVNRNIRLMKENFQLKSEIARYMNKAEKEYGVKFADNIADMPERQVNNLFFSTEAEMKNKTDLLLVSEQKPCPQEKRKVHSLPNRNSAVPKCLLKPQNPHQSSSITSPFLSIKKRGNSALYIKS